jgi:hypothetical protein
MDFVAAIVGRRPVTAAPLPDKVIETPPKGVTWTEVRARPSARTVRAKLAKKRGVLRTARGPMAYQPGQHYIVHYGGGDRAVARRDMFERAYLAKGDGAYEKRPEIAYRYFTLPYEVAVKTAEGLEHAKAGDWIMEGGAGELYPISPDRAREIYETA